MNSLERLLRNAAAGLPTGVPPIAAGLPRPVRLSSMSGSFGEDQPTGHSWRDEKAAKSAGALPNGSLGDLDDDGLGGPDPQQFLRLFLENERRIYAFIVSILPNLSDAEDVLQETSLILWQKFGQFELGTDFVAWACRVAQFRVMKFYERRGRSKLNFDASALEAVANEAIGMAPLLEDRHHALAKCLDALPPRDRDLLQRRYADDASPKQIATQVGRSVHAIYKALSRIHDALLDCIQRRLDKEWNG